MIELADLFHVMSSITHYNQLNLCNRATPSSPQESHDRNLFTLRYKIGNHFIIHYFYYTYEKTIYTSGTDNNYFQLFES